jgi:hypothetical protein
MAEERTEAIEALLVEAKRAHGVYETTELDGVYDQEWPRWYAAYAVDHGIGDLIGHPVSAEELAAYLGRTNVEFDAIQPKPTEPWAAYTARRIAAEL